MPNLEITTRHSKKFIDDISEGELKRNQREFIKKRFGITAHIDQTIITTGDPDKNGDLEEQNELAIRAVMNISQEEYDKLERDMAK